MLFVIISQSKVQKFVNNAQETGQLTRHGRVCYIGGTLLKGGADMAEIFMAGILFAASYFDWKIKKIPNWIVMLGLIPAVQASMCSGSIRELAGRLFSMVLIFFLFWWVYLAGGVGAGDVKLFMLLAGVCGLLRLLYILLIAFVSACLFSAAAMRLLKSGSSAIEKKTAGIVKMMGPAEMGDHRHHVILAPFVTLGYVLILAEGWWA